MGRDRRMGGLATLLAAIGGLAVLALVAGALLLLRALPDYQAEVRVSGLQAPVTIARDAHAIPHIHGASDADVFFGLGYAHAQDRIFQMEMMRRAAEGRLSEMLGPATLKTDALMRRYDIPAAAAASYAVQDATTQAALRAYAAGVNAWLASHRGFGARAPEFLILPERIAPWRPEDSLALLKLLSLQLASHIDREVLRARVSRVVPPERLRDILPDDPHAGSAALPKFAEMFPGLPADDGRFAGLENPVIDFDGSLSSNAWAVAPGRSANGAALMANDPHLNFSAPSVWYLAELDLAGGAVIGGTVPGIPLVLSGRSDKLGWGLTTANVDDQDVYLEKLDPENPDAVLTPDGYKPLRRRHEEIAVKGRAPVGIDLAWSENGPVIPGDFYNFNEITPPGYVVSVARVLFEPADTSMTAGMKLMRAQSVEAAIAAAEGFVTPAQNLTVVDRDHIALKTIGRMPARDPGHRTLGRMPSEGWLAVNRWHGYLPYSDNPEVIDPASGAVGNTNNKTVDRVFPWHVSWDWGDTQRIQRLREILAGQESFGVGDFAAMQADALSVPARVLVPLALPKFTPVGPRAAQAVALLKTWDYRMRADRPEPLIFEAWMRAFEHRLAAGALGPLAEAFPKPNAVFLERVLRDTDGASAWCGGLKGAGPADCGGVLSAALQDALDEIAPKGDLARLRWGDVHYTTHDNQVLGRLPGLGWLVNLRAPASGGDDTLLRGLTTGKEPTPFADIHGAGYRGIYDLAKSDASLFIAATGQSGNPLSRHYRDMNRLWREGGYLPMRTRLRPGEVKAVTRLEPG